MTLIKYTIEPEIEVNGIRIIPVVKISISYSFGKSGVYCSSYKTPAAVIVISDSFKKIFRANGEEIETKALFNEYPDLTAVFKKYF